MSTFRIWCRAQPVGESQFLAVVTAIPADIDPNASGRRMESESRLHTTQEAAMHACHEMSAAMKERIEQRGDAVEGVDTV